MKTYLLCLLSVCTLGLAAQPVEEPVKDTGKIAAGKLGMDFRINVNQASVGGIYHITSWLAVSPYLLYRSDESVTYSNASYYAGPATDKSSYFGGGTFLPLYLTRIENLYVKLMPGFYYTKGTSSYKQDYTPSSGLTSYSTESSISRFAFQLFLGLQYAVNNRFHIIAETGLNYYMSKTSNQSTADSTSKTWNLYSGNIGLIFYFN